MTDLVSNLVSDLFYVEPWVLSLFFGTYALLGALEYLILLSGILSRRIRYFLIMVPTAVLTAFYLIAFPGLRLITIGIMTAWGFAKFFISKVEREVERAEQEQKPQVGLTQG